MSADILSTGPNSDLFMENGSSMVFHLPPGGTKKKLAPVIKKYGGEVTSRRLKNIICVADEKLWTSKLDRSKSDCIWPTYIVDCIKEDTLLDVEQYKCSRGTRLMRTISLEDDEEYAVTENSFERDDALSTIIACRPVDLKGRRRYTQAEDMNILRYLMDYGEYRRAKGIAVWRTMAQLQITPHSASSMMTHYRDVIFKQLDQYPIPNSWRSRLTGDLVSHASDQSTDLDGDEEDQVAAADQAALDGNTQQMSLRQSGSSKSLKQVQPLPRKSGTDKTVDCVVSVEEDSEDEFDRQLMQMSSTPLDRESDVTTRSTRVRKNSQAKHSPAKRRRQVGKEAGALQQDSEDEDVDTESVQTPKKRLGRNSEKQNCRGPGQEVSSGDEVKRNKRYRTTLVFSEEDFSDQDSCPDVQPDSVRHRTRSKDQNPKVQNLDHQRRKTRSRNVNEDSRRQISEQDSQEEGSASSLSIPAGRLLRNSRSSPRRSDRMSQQNASLPRMTPSKRPLPENGTAFSTQTLQKSPQTQSRLRSQQNSPARTRSGQPSPSHTPQATKGASRSSSPVKRDHSKKSPSAAPSTSSPAPSTSSTAPAPSPASRVATSSRSPLRGENRRKLAPATSSPAPSTSSTAPATSTAPSTSSPAPAPQVASRVATSSRSPLRGENRRKAASAASSTSPSATPSTSAACAASEAVKKAQRLQLPEFIRSRTARNDNQHLAQKHQRNNKKHQRDEKHQDDDSDDEVNTSMEQEEFMRLGLGLSLQQSNKNQRQGQGEENSESASFGLADREDLSPKEDRRPKTNRSLSRPGGQHKPRRTAGGPSPSSSATEADYTTAEESSEGSRRILKRGQNPAGDRTSGVRQKSQDDNTQGMRPNSKRIQPVATSSRHMMQAFVCSSDEEEAASQERGKGKHRRMTALGVLRALSAEFDLTMSEARRLLVQNSGHIEATRYWIQTGHTLPDEPCLQDHKIGRRWRRGGFPSIFDSHEKMS